MQYKYPPTPLLYTSRIQAPSQTVIQTHRVRRRALQLPANPNPSAHPYMQLPCIYLFPAGTKIERNKGNEQTPHFPFSPKPFLSSSPYPPPTSSTWTLAEPPTSAILRKHPYIKSPNSQTVVKSLTTPDPITFNFRWYKLELQHHSQPLTSLPVTPAHLCTCLQLSSLLSYYFVYRQHFILSISDYPLSPNKLSREVIIILT